MCLGIINEVPNDEIVICIAHAVDYGQFIFSTLHIVVDTSCGRCYFKSLLQALICKIRKVFSMVLIPLRNFIYGKMNCVEIIFGIAHVGNPAGILDSFR